MPRTRRLPPVSVSHIETHHAYTRPPIPEKGGLPTIIVTPSDPVSPQDFQIHFVNTDAPHLPNSKRGWVMGWFGNKRRPGSLLQGLGVGMGEKEPYAQYAYSPIPTIVAENGDTTCVDEAEYTSPLWLEAAPSVSTTISTSNSKKSSWFGRRVRLLLFFTIPLLLLAVHLVGYRLGFFGNSSDRLAFATQQEGEVFIVEDDVTVDQLTLVASATLTGGDDTGL